MRTPILMPALLVAPYLVVRSIAGVTHRNFDVRGAAAIGLGLVFIFTGIGHFTQTELMAQMLPPWAPARVILIYLTGVLEFAIAKGFFTPKFRRFTGWVAGVLLALSFPAHSYTAIHHVPMGGHAWGPAYLLIRTPLQALMLFWVYWFTIRQPGPALHEDAPQAARRVLRG